MPTPDPYGESCALAASVGGRGARARPLPPLSQSGSRITRSRRLHDQSAVSTAERRASIESTIRCGGFDSAPSFRKTILT